MNKTALNPNLEKLSVDFLYHLGLSNADNLKGMFGDTKHVAMMGSADRAYTFAQKLHEQLGDPIQYFGEMPKLEFGKLGKVMEYILNLLSVNMGYPVPIGKTERFSMYKVGDTISVSHGMGQPSHSILLHEVTKMLHYAGATDFKYYRLGTSGGVGVEPGTVVVADKGLAPSGRAEYVTDVLGEPMSLETDFDLDLAQDILAVRGNIEAVLGSTMSADDFYTVQARLDGAFCMITPEEKQNYLQKLYGLGARNIEMEAAAFGAFCKKMGIPAACMCVALLNRLDGDQVTSTPKQLGAFSDNPQQLLIQYIASTRKQQGAGQKVA